MNLSMRTKALLLCGAVFAISLVLAVHFLNANRGLVILGGADGPTTVVITNSANPQNEAEKRELQRAQLQTRLEETICQVEGVEGASVSLFADGDSTEYQSAAVSIRLLPGAALTDEQCAGIQTLVSGATGLAAADVELSVAS